GIAPEEVEEKLRRKRRQLDSALLERLQQLVLHRRRQLIERLFVLRAAVIGDLADADAVDLLRRQARLEPLLGCAVLPRPRAVVAAVSAPRAEQLTIDEAGDSGIAGARAELVGGYQPLYGGIEKANFRRCQITVCVQQPGLRH